MLEGVEGAGKTTQVELLRHRFTQEGVSHTVSREPGGTAVGEGIRELLLERREMEISPETELFLILAARAAFVREVVTPALARGEVVLADRFQLSTFAYQGFGRGLELEAVRTANRFATGGLSPDLTVLLDVPVLEGLGRQRAMGKVRDRMEDGGQDFLRKVREGYRTLAREEEDVVLLDGTLSSEAVHGRVVELLRTRFPGHFPETFTASPG